MQTHQHRLMRMTKILAVGLAGGTLAASCQGRIRDSIVQGTQLFVADLLSTENLVNAFVPDANGEDVTVPADQVSDDLAVTQ